MPPEQKILHLQVTAPSKSQHAPANISYPEIIQNKDSYGDDGDSIFTYF